MGNAAQRANPWDFAHYLELYAGLSILERVREGLALAFDAFFFKEATD